MGGAAGMFSVMILVIFLVVVYGILVIRGVGFSKGGDASTLVRILIASGFAALVLGLFITGFIKKDIRVLLNVFAFLSAGSLATAFFIHSVSGKD
jgi:hypothetical protein